MMDLKGLPRNQAVVTEKNRPTTTQFLRRSEFKGIFLIPRSTIAEIAEKEIKSITTLRRKFFMVKMVR
jgi:hypothetical protein